MIPPVKTYLFRTCCAFYLVALCSCAPYSFRVQNSYRSDVIPTEEKADNRVTPLSVDLKQFEQSEQPITCVSDRPAPPNPSQEDVQDFLDIKPPVPPTTGAFESKGLFEGDMTGMSVMVDPAKHQILTPMDITAETMRWPNKIIPYGFYEKIDRKSMEVTLDAMADLESKTCLRFVPLTYQEDYLKISPGQACASDVGYSKGEHILSVNHGCMDDLGALQHEIMHALGIIHEQARPDRDPFVYVNFSNIKQDIGSQAQFYVFKNAEIMDTGIPYDYSSVMHYPFDAFAVNREVPSIMPKEKGKMIGNRVELSPLDIKRLNRMYRCDDNPLDEKKNEIPQETRERYRQTFKDWEKLCDLNKDTPEAWDEDPDVCMDMCRRLDSKKLGPDGSNLFNRPSTKQCLHKRMFCDGTGNGSYDKLYQPDICRKFCRLGGYVNMPVTAQCVHYSKLCNGKVDTQNAEDEDPADAYGSSSMKDCELGCPVGHWKPSTSTDKRWSSREAKAYPEEEVCQDLCQSKDTGFFGQLFNSEEAGMRCLKKVALCDGKSTGPMGEPEYCRKYCKGGGFFPVGDSAQCIHWRKLCDGHVDTISGLDEDSETCGRLCALARQESGRELFSMPTTKQCVSKRWLCDGTQHDKDNLLASPGFCRQKCRGSGFDFAPDTLQCYHVTDLCDGKQDVRNGWDENPRNCDKFCHGSKKWPAPGLMVGQTEDTRKCVVVDSSGSGVPGQRVTATNHSAEFGPVPVEPLSFVFGSREPHRVAGQDNAWELLISNNTHEVLACPSGQEITLLSATYSGGTCPDLSALANVTHKCNDLPACGYIARDPSTSEGCSGRSMLVQYLCKPPSSVFRTDPSAADLCAPQSGKNTCHGSKDVGALKSSIVHAPTAHDEEIARLEHFRS